MKISALITVHNRFKLLRANLLSLSHQSRIPDQVVISDDGSDENIFDMLKPIAASLPFSLKYVRQEHRGFRAARVRNNAANLASGELLIFLDQDIVGTRGFIQTFEENARANSFLVAWPIRLTDAQTAAITDRHLQSSDFSSIVTTAQMSRISSQYRKERTYFWLHAMGLRHFGPKLRSGLFSLFRHDYFRVNGFDEMYKGWGNEDDDLGRRLHAAGIHGRNPFLREYPLHLYHEPNRRGNERPNLQYYAQRVAEIKAGDFRCRYGVENPLDEENLQIVDLC